MNAFRELYVTDIPWWSLALRAVLVYVAVILLLRIAGKRQVGQMGMTEFVALLLISNAVQNAMNGGDNSVTAGIITAATLVAMNYLVGLATFKSKKLEALIAAQPEARPQVRSAPK